MMSRGFGCCLDRGAGGAWVLRMNVAGQSALAIAISLARRDGAEIGPELTLVVHRELNPPQTFPTDALCLAGALRLNLESDSVSRYPLMF